MKYAVALSIETSTQIGSEVSKKVSIKMSEHEAVSSAEALGQALLDKWGGNNCRLTAFACMQLTESTNHPTN